jgi:hypothetical protein
MVVAGVGAARQRTIWMRLGLHINELPDAMSETAWIIVMKAVGKPTGVKKVAFACGLLGGTWPCPSSERVIGRQAGSMPVHDRTMAALVRHILLMRADKRHIDCRILAHSRSGVHSGSTIATLWDAAQVALNAADVSAI